ncbi:hypothetical protein I4F81_005271 [Pyropia yezoensis]|uniref:Uncharacterized protein n=1 Tax=Pyropia yezoensis TaxID=2788 RepID=A0ACC3BYB9_PYRYE|nr:hypothetical protein I4F81_005271 [Neopyropia yezoensis]
MASPSDRTSRAVQAVAACARRFSLSPNDVESGVELQVSLLFAVGDVRDAYLSTLLQTGRAVGSVGQRAGAVRCSWDAVCAWARDAAASGGEPDDDVALLELPFVADLSAAVCALMHYRSRDVEEVAKRVAGVLSTDVVDAGYAYLSWPPPAADYRVWQLLLAWTGRWQQLADLEDAVSRSRGCLPLTGRSPGATAVICAMESMSGMRFDADVGQSWLGDVLAPALPSVHRSARRRVGARRHRASSLTPFEQVLWLSRVIELTGGTPMQHTTARQEQLRELHGRQSRQPPRHQGVQDTSGGTSSALVRAHAISEVVARAVRSLVRAWDALARRARFSSAEEMLGPYILWSPSRLKYEALVEGGIGRLAPLAQSRDLFHGLVPSAVRGSVDPEALGRSPVADEQLRLASKLFLSHLETVTSRVDILGFALHPSTEPRYRLKSLHANTRRRGRVAGSSSGSALPAHPQAACLSLAHYRLPRSLCCADGVPPILAAISAGLNALAPPEDAAEDGGKLPFWDSSSSSEVSDGSDSSKSDDRSRSSSSSSSSSRSRSSGGGGTRSSQGETVEDWQSVLGDSSRTRSSGSGSSSSSGGGSRSDRTWSSGGTSPAGQVVPDSPLRRISLSAVISDLYASCSSAEGVGYRRQPGSGIDTAYAGSVLAAAGPVVPLASVHPLIPARRRGFLPALGGVMLSAAGGSGGSVGRRTAAAGGAAPVGSPLARSTSPTPSSKKAAASSSLVRSAQEGLSVAEAQGVVSAALSKVVWTHSGDYKDFLKAHEAHRGGSASEAEHKGIVGQVQLVLTDPPYNTRREQNAKHSEYDVMGAEDYTFSVRLFRDLVRPGGHVLIFCSFQQWSLWVDALRACQDDWQDAGEHGARRGSKRSRDGGGSAAGAPKSQSPAFIVDGVPLLVIKDPHSFSFGQTFSSVVLTSKAEIVVHATRRGLSPSEAHARVSYRGFGYVASDYAASTNIVNNVRSLPRAEVVLRNPSARSGGFLRPEQKGLALLQELIARFSHPLDLVADPFCGTLSVAVAALTMRAGQYRRALVGDSDAACIAASRGRLLRAFVSAVLQGGLAEHVDGRIVRACRVLAEASLREDIASGIQYLSQSAYAYGSSYTAPFPSLPRPVAYQLDMQVPAGQPAHCALPDVLISWLASRWAVPHAGMVSDGERVSMPQILALRGVAVDRWPLELRCRLMVEDLDAMRCAEAASLGVAVAPSSVNGGAGGLGIFALR